MPSDPVLTLSGIGNDIAACSDNSCAVEFIAFDGVKQFSRTPDIYATASFGNTLVGGPNAAEQYDAANYSLVQVDAVPLPASAALLGGALGLFVLTGRRKRPA